MFFFRPKIPARQAMVGEPSSAGYGGSVTTQVHYNHGIGNGALKVATPGTLTLRVAVTTKPGLLLDRDGSQSCFLHGNAGIATAESTKQGGYCLKQRRVRPHAGMATIRAIRYHCLLFVASRCFKPALFRSKSVNQSCKSSIFESFAMQTFKPPHDT